MVGVYELLDRWEIEIKMGRFLSKGLLYRPHGDGQVRIGINSDLDLKERTFTFIHELLHIKFNIDNWKSLAQAYAKRHKYRYRDYRPNLDSDRLNGVLEDIIDEEAQEIYDCQPRLVEYLIEKHKLDREAPHSDLPPSIWSPLFHW